LGCSEHRCVSSCRSLTIKFEINSLDLTSFKPVRSFIYGSYQCRSHGKGMIIQMDATIHPFFIRIFEFSYSWMVSLLSGFVGVAGKGCLSANLNLVFNTVKPLVWLLLLLITNSYLLPAKPYRVILPNRCPFMRNLKISLFLQKFSIFFILPIMRNLKVLRVLRFLR
jgi:hypothetical protein